MGVLGPGLGLILAEGAGPVGGAVAAVDERTGGHLGLMGDAQRIGTHIGNKTHGALAAELHALIQLLGDGHGAAGGHIQFAGGLLLEGGGGEGRGRRALLIRPLHALDGEGPGHNILTDGLGLRLGGGLVLFAVFPVVMGLEKGLIPLLMEQGIQGPILLGHEGLDFLLPLGHQTHGHGLDPAGRQTPADLLPQQRGQAVAHDTV